MSKDLTMQEAIADDLIEMVNAADGVDQRSFAKLLEDIAVELSAVVLERRSQIRYSDHDADTQSAGPSPAA
jgi:hypothetical protein